MTEKKETSNIEELEKFVSATLLGKVAISTPAKTEEGWTVRDKMYFVRKTGVVKCFHPASEAEMKKGKMINESTLPDKYFSIDELVSDLKAGYEFSAKLSYTFSPEVKGETDSLLLLADSEEDLLNMIHYKHVAARDHSRSGAQINLKIEDEWAREGYFAEFSS